ncbi:MAG: BlaI/MecI/CopY family transcriptional regulator [Fuerstiella sp.]
MKKIGQAEWEIMQFVADRHPVTVRDVADHMSDTRGLARTTVLTVLERLREKKHLTRRKRNGIYHYAPRLEKSELLKQVVGEFMENTLQGTLSPFVAWLAGKPDISPQELQQLKQVVDELESRSEESSHD